MKRSGRIRWLSYAGAGAVLILGTVAAESTQAAVEPGCELKLNADPECKGNKDLLERLCSEYVSDAKLGYASAILADMDPGFERVGVDVDKDLEPLPVKGHTAQRAVTTPPNKVENGQRWDRAEGPLRHDEYLRGLALVWPSRTFTPDLGSASCEIKPGATAKTLIAEVPWTFDGTFYANKKSYRLAGRNQFYIYDYEKKPRLYHESVRVDPVSEATWTADSAGADMAREFGGPTTGVMKGTITINGNNAPNGTDVVCIDGAAPYDTVTTTAGQYTCPTVTPGTVTLRADGQQDGPCPNPVVDGQQSYCNANVTGCGNPTVSFTMVMAPGSLALSRWLQRVRRRFAKV